MWWLPGVDVVYNQVTSYTGLALGIATLFYAFQVYCDFSGYSDIARGVATLFDIELVNNFKSPYFSASVKEFWSRWHISLSSWRGIISTFLWEEAGRAPFEPIGT